VSNRTKRRPAPGKARSGPATKPGLPILPLALGALLLVVVVGIGIAVASEEDEDDRPAWGPVEAQGTALPTLGDGPDGAVGQPAPRLVGMSPDGDAVTVGDGPALIAFVAHWCPHCQVEVPILVDMFEDGAFEDVRLVAVATDSQRGAKNFPPARWLDGEDWPGDVVLDDEQQTAARAYGISGYPFLVAVDADGTVVARTSGEVPREAVEQMLATARGQ